MNGGVPVSKLTLKDVTTGFESASLQNSNNDAIEAAIENSVSRDGSTPNQMQAQFDLNSNRIINLGAPANNNDAARLQDLLDNSADLSSTTAVATSVGDTGGFFSSTTVEGVLQELGESNLENMILSTQVFS